MKVQIVSDLHLESPKAYDFYQITPTAPYLALLGDIGCVRDQGYLAFLTTQLQQFQLVLHVLGNHERYGSTWAAVLDTLHAFAREHQKQRAANPTLGEYVLLDRTEYTLPPPHNITILGCTLFSHVPAHARDDESGTAVYSNQRGYYFAQAPGWDERRVIKMDSDGQVAVEEGTPVDDGGSTPPLEGVSK